MQSLEDARLQFEDGLSEGIICPCCDRFAKKYTRSLNATMARGLIWLYCQTPGGFDWVNIQSTGPAWLLRSSQMSSTTLWGLVEKQPSKDRAKSASGVYRLTDRGRLFTLGLVAIPRQVIEYRGVPLEYSTDTIYIRAALQNKFDYSALMKGGVYA